MKNQDIDKLFRDHFDKLDIQPDAKLWERIKNDLDEQKIKPIKKKTNWLKPLLTIAAALIFIGTFSLFVLHHSVNVSEIKISATNKVDTSIQIQQKVTKTNPIKIIKNKQQLAVKEVNKENNHIQNVAASVAPYTAVTPVEAANTFEKLELKREQPIVAVPESQIQIASVAEYIPIKPLIENPEEESSMMAAASTGSQNVVTKVLNIISKTINQGNTPEIQFSNDAEGSLQIDLFNGLVKNKKRKN